MEQLILEETIPHSLIHQQQQHPTKTPMMKYIRRRFKGDPLAGHFVNVKQILSIQSQRVYLCKTLYRQATITLTLPESDVANTQEEALSSVPDDTSSLPHIDVPVESDMEVVFIEEKKSGTTTSQQYRVTGLLPNRRFSLRRPSLGFLKPLVETKKLKSERKRRS